MDTVELAFDVYQYEDTDSDLNPIVMMLGMLWSKFLYRDIARDLCQATRRKVFCLDLRDHGESPSTGNATIDLMKKDVKRFLTEQKLKQVAFVCHSFSNTIAYVIALEQPETVEKLLMIDNPPFNDYSDDFIKESALPQVLVQNRLLASLDDRMSLKEAKAKFYNFARMSGKGQEQFFKKLVYDLTKENGKFRWKKDINYMKGQFAKGKLALRPRGHSNKDILIIRCADSSRVTDSKFKAVFRHNPNAKLLTFENTTHLLMFEEQERFVQAAKYFLQNSDS